MKRILFFLSFLIVCNIHAQKGDQYKFDKIYTKRLILKGTEPPEIYEVFNKEISGTKNVKTVNPEYALSLIHI